MANRQMPGWRRKFPAMSPEFVPFPPAGFEMAGAFNGVTTAVGPGGAPRIRYQLTGIKFRSGGLIGFATRQVLKTGAGHEVTLGSLHTRLSLALIMVGDHVEAGSVERFEHPPSAALVLGRYFDRNSGLERYGAIALVKGAPGMIEILVTECDTAAESREVINAALAPYL
jgi:hypothetical protein